jgi:hypothetical protein
MEDVSNVYRGAKKVMLKSNLIEPNDQKGQSVFITRKNKQKVEPNLFANEELIDDTWFFTHL